MTQYDDKVELQRVKLAAAEWANGVKSMHAHQLKSMWYDDRPQDTDNSPVSDLEFNDGRVKRTIIETGEVIWMNTSNQVTGEALIYEFERRNHGS